MTTVLVTGASGQLGRLVVPRLVAAGYDVRGMTRSAAKAAAIRAAGATAVVANLVEDAGPGGVTLVSAVADVDHVVHLASRGGRDAERTDVGGTAALLDARDESAPAAVLTYVSIVGCDRTPMGYYQAKTRAEELVRARANGRVVRATQFHELLARLVKVVPGLRRVPVPAGWLFQPVAATDVATILIDGLESGLPAQIGGPEVLTSEEVARRRSGLGVVPVMVPGRLSAAIRSGSLLADADAQRGTTVFPRGRASRG